MPDVDVQLQPAAAAFDAVAPVFDTRFGAWQSVSAQRDAVRRVLVDVFPPGSHLLELGGGTAEDAAWLTQRGYRVTLTDPSPSMIAIATNKLRGTSSSAEVMSAENLELGNRRFDGVFSNFAALNCVPHLSDVARGMARAVSEGSSAVLVFFGPLPPGEIVVQLLKGSPSAALRRLHTSPVAARVGGHSFNVHYHRPNSIRAAFAPWFELVARRGIGVFVPSSAAEPWISRHPALLRSLASIDRVVSRPLALLGDHLLFHFVRTAASADER